MCCYLLINFIDVIHDVRRVENRIMQDSMLQYMQATPERHSNHQSVN